MKSQRAWLSAHGNNWTMIHQKKLQPIIDIKFRCSFTVHVDHRLSCHHGLAHLAVTDASLHPPLHSLYPSVCLSDVRLELPVTGFEPLMTSSPSPPISSRQRTTSVGSSSSISTTYQDITSSLLGQALAEVTTDPSAELI